MAVAGAPPAAFQTGGNAGREGAARALQNMSLSEEYRLLIAELGGLRVLVAMLRDGPPSCRDAAAGAVESLALSDANRLLLLEEGAVEALVDMLWAGGSDLGRRTAARAIINMAFNDTCKAEIAKVSFDAGAGAALMMIAMPGHLAPMSSTPANLYNCTQH